jgi:hypothetical protein
MAVGHRLLDRVQSGSGFEALDRKERLPVERWQKLYAGIHRAGAQSSNAIQFGQDNRAGAAIALGATFFGPGATQILTQEIEDGLRGERAGDTANLAIE